MSPAVEVPITPEVLQWAIDASGYSIEEVANEAGIEVDDLAAWLDPESGARPNLTSARSLAQVLRRPLAVFLLPRPPKAPEPEVKFRHLPGAQDRRLSPVERRFVRKAGRLQKMLDWLCVELDEAAPPLRAVRVNGNAVRTASDARQDLDIDLSVQLGWNSSSMAFDGWRAAVEDRFKVAVLLFPMGNDSCRGFSLWHERAPIVAINTHWNDEARIFTLFHELGHLVTRTDSACSMAPGTKDAARWDPAERWCEEFAAALLLPAEAVRRQLSLQAAGPLRPTVETVKRLARRFHVSLRAVAIRLIELNLSTWELYHELPAASDGKRGGGGGKGRDRQEIQEDQLGPRTFLLFQRALRADLLSRSQALSYLDVPDVALDQR